MVDLDLLGHIFGQAPPKPPPKGNAHPAFQAPVSRKDDEAQEGDAFGDRPSLSSILVQGQAEGRQPLNYGGTPVTQLPFVVAEEQKIVNIAQVSGALEVSLDEVIKGIEVAVGPELGGQVTYR